MNLPALPQTVGLLDVDEVGIFREEVETLLDSIFLTYAGESSRELFQLKCFFRESVHMRIAAFRLGSCERLDFLRDRAITTLSQSTSQDHDSDSPSTDQQSKYLLHPIFHLRVSYPEQYDQHGGGGRNDPKSALLESQPHYDRSFGLYQHTFGMAINDLDLESGGTCFFKNSPQVMDLFAVEYDGRNQYNYTSYIEDSTRIDELIQSSIIYGDLKAGQAYWFDSAVLHGGTRPISRLRMSFDFRVIPADNNNAESLSRDGCIQLFNEHRDFCNSMNLLMLGDIEGAVELTPNLHHILEEDELSHYAIYDPFDFGQQVEYRDLYSWVSNFCLERLDRK